jgi:hypothetical protein
VLWAGLITEHLSGGCDSESLGGCGLRRLRAQTGGGTAGVRACGGEQSDVQASRAVKRAQNGTASIATKTAKRGNEADCCEWASRETQRAINGSAAMAAIARGPTGGHGFKLRNKADLSARDGC